MNTNELIQRAVEKATSPFNFVYSPTTRALKNLNVTKDGLVCIKHGLITVPVEVFRFSIFRSEKYRVVLKKNDLSVVEILRS